MKMENNNNQLGNNINLCRLTHAFTRLLIYKIHKNCTFRQKVELCLLTDNKSEIFVICNFCNFSCLTVTPNIEHQSPEPRNLSPLVRQVLILSLWVMIAACFFFFHSLREKQVRTVPEVHHKM